MVIRDRTRPAPPVPDETTLAARARWRFRGQSRPPFADKTGSHQLSVWDFPRPPSIHHDPRLVTISCGSTRIALTRDALVVSETANPPAWYLPPAAIDGSRLQVSQVTTYCEWKGVAAYFDVAVDGRVFEAAAWTYPNPFEEYRALTDLIAFYPHALECRVNNKRVLPQEGQVYAGWITSDLSGPFKGAPGTEDW